MSSTKPRTSLLFRPPVSNATTTSRHRSPPTSSAYLASLCQQSSFDSGRVCPRRSTRSHCASENDVDGQLCSVVEPKTGRNNFHLSLSSVAGTCTFVSRSCTLRVTVAPASPHSRAKVLSVGTARRFNLPERAQTKFPVLL